MKISVHCGHCDGYFDFEHPAVTHAAQLKNFSLTCAWCGLQLRMPANSIHLEPVDLPENVIRLPRRA